MSCLEGKRIDHIANLINDFSYDLGEAIVDLDGILDEYEEGWEDRALDRTIGLKLCLEELLARIEILTSERWVDLGGGGLVDEP